jgi:uncharacterized protein
LIQAASEAREPSPARQPGTDSAGSDTAGSNAGAPAARLAGQDFVRVQNELDLVGWSVLEQVLTPDECLALAALYTDEGQFRSTVVMARHNFGRGEYKYFAYPLPAIVAELRAALYAALVPTARRWHHALGLDAPAADSVGVEATLPDSHARYVARCHEAGQRRPTPLLLSYGAGDYNCLHQDVYGELVFPLQVAILLSEPGRDYTGGELVLTEQRPRMQSRAEVVPLARGDAAVFAVRERPMPGTRGVYRVQMRHGVSRVRSGQRRVLGIIFHDAT